MLNPFHAALVPALEARKVVELPLARIVQGGAEGQAEMVSMA